MANRDYFTVNNSLPLGKLVGCQEKENDFVCNKLIDIFLIQFLSF